MTVTTQNCTELSVEAENLRRSSMSPETVRAYASHWNKFVDWCRSTGVKAIPTTTTTMANYLGTIPSDRSLSTITGIVSAIKKKHGWHREQIIGLPSVYEEVVDGFRREHPKVVHRAPPISLELLERTVPTIPETLVGTRNRAMLLLDFFTGFRRSEITSLLSEHVVVLPCGNLSVTLLQSKTNILPETLYVYRRSEEKASVCPVRAVEEWRRLSAITSGQLFRRFTPSGRMLDDGIQPAQFNKVLKQYFGTEFSGHSMRRGVATAMDTGGMSIPEISSRLRHKSTQTTMGYVEVNRGIQAAENMEKAFAKAKQ
jgi:integrase